MSIPAAVLGWALLLSQVESETAAPGSPTEERPTEERSTEERSTEERSTEERSTEERSTEERPAPEPVRPASGPPDFPLDPATPLPALRHDAPVLCAEFPSTQRVPSGAYRMQCDAETKECFVAPAHELDADGEETRRPLERVQGCSAFIQGASRAEEGYRLLPAVADAPPGWYRDERGRVMQFNFDLHRRVWLGAAWAPLWRRDSEEALRRMRVDFSIRTEVPSNDDRVLNRFSFLETQLYLGPQRGVDATLMRYDFSTDRDRPLLRVSTFLGRPRRFDLEADMGAWFEVVRLEQLHRNGTEASFLTIAAAHATLDLWHSRDMVSFVRLRAGPSLEQDRTNGFSTFVPGAALEGDLTLDPNGFHHLRFGAEAEKVYLDKEVAGRPLNPERLVVRAGYETILLALNDQPLSLVLDGRGTWRSDIPNVPADWEWTAQAGLRFSMWAPARRSASLAQAR